VTDEEARIDVEGRQAKLAQILSEGADAAGMGLLSLPPKPTRKPRSDKGVPKKKPAAAPTAQGVLSAAQVARLRDLIETKERRSLEADAASAHFSECDKALVAVVVDLNDYLNELAGKQA